MNLRVFMVVLLLAVWGCSSPSAPTAPQLSSERTLTSFGISSPAETGSITGTNISVAVPYGTSVTNLVATFKTTGARVKVGGVTQTSGVTPNDFTNPVDYTVFAEDGESQSYRVTVAVSPSSAKALLSLDFPSADLLYAGSSGTNFTFTVPYGSDVTSMVATFTTTGTAVKIGSVVQVSGVTVNNFTKPVIYTVYAADGTSQNYTVTVNVSPGNDKDLTSFSWGRTIGTISGNSVSIMAPVGADITHLVTKFTSTGTAVSVNGVAQQSEVTANDFTNPVTYVVTALNGTTQAYTVTATPSQGTMSTLAGSLSGPFAYPHFLAIDQRGVVYVSDYSHNEIKAIGLDGAVSVAYRSDSSNLSAPTGISLDPGTGTLWVADSAGAVSLVELPVSGGYSNQSVSLNAPMEIAQYDTDAVLIADSGSNSIIDTDGSYGSVIASGLHQPYGIAVNASKTIFIADTYSHHILQMHLANPMPSPTVFAGSASTTGSQDGTGTAASFDLPTGLAVDPAGNLWVTDMGNNTVRKITPAGVVTTIVSSDAGLDTPIGVAVDPWGEVFVCDMNNGAIKMIQ